MIHSFYPIIKNFFYFMQLLQLLAQMNARFPVAVEIPTVDVVNSPFFIKTHLCMIAFPLVVEITRRGAQPPTTSTKMVNGEYVEVIIIIIYSQLPHDVRTTWYGRQNDVVTTSKP